MPANIPAATEANRSLSAPLRSHYRRQQPDESLPFLLLGWEHKAEEGGSGMDHVTQLEAALE